MSRLPTRPPWLLAIESSCDETAVALLDGFSELRASLVHSQIPLHAGHGGVVPELASRDHLRVLPGLVRQVLSGTGADISRVSAFAATSGPGLAPALLVGLSHAKAMAIGCRRPFFPINHIEGHLLSPFFGRETIPAHVGLVVSGGHTLLVHVRGFGDYTLLGSTRDDAAGEAFDKTGKLLGLPYPGGIEVDRLAEHGDPCRFDFPRAMLHGDRFAFSFSGIKTAARYLVERGAVQNTRDLADFCASFRQAIVDVLASKALAAARSLAASTLAVSGGVSANLALRRRMDAEARSGGLQIFFAPQSLRTDNAAMIAFVAAHRLAAQYAAGISTDRPDRDDLDEEPKPGLFDFGGDWSRPA